MFKLTPLFLPHARALASYTGRLVEDVGERHCCFDHADMGIPIMEMRPRLTGEAKHLMGGGGGSAGRCMWIGEATAVHRCSRVLSRCSTSSPSNWQMASDAR
ncbi:hypothetical protein VZT92_015393 [Zoarces viviparus]|uniref:Uncharacterized protein n=1 Tax=Zoarces viviparus TaxID=48416 RepID=A0AAW1EWC2_ZOAVI